MKNEESKSGIGEWGPTQTWAVVWLFAILGIGVTAISNLSRIDAFMYQTEGDVYDYQAYSENRTSQASITSEVIDERTQNATYSAVVDSLDEK